MRETEKLLYEDDNKKNIINPLVYVLIALVLLIGIMIWFGIKKPEIFADISNLVISIFALLFFILGAALAVLCFFLSSRIDNAKLAIDKVLVDADGKVEGLADKIVDILKRILDPLVEANAKTSGFLQVFSNKNSEE